MTKFLQRSLALMLCIGMLTQVHAIDFRIDKKEALPVELSYFRGLLSNGNALLIWGTTIQQNNSGFEIQRKTSNGWETIEFVEGEGTTDVGQKYKYLDEDMEVGMNFYRLIMMDINGSYELSEVVMVEKKKKKGSLGISMYPNPATNTFMVTNMEGNATIYNATGTVVKILEINQSNQSVDVTDLSEGMYYIEFVQGDEARQTKRFYKVAQ
ncbi:MAG: T9SS type A sorting domain-containing protein [Saprospiraceae bacterium]